MKSYKNLFVAVAVCFAAVAALHAPQVEAKEPSSNAKAVYKYLQNEGYQPEYDDDGDVYFKKEGGLYYAIFDQDDDEFFRLWYPNFWEITSYSEWKHAVNAARVVNNTTKVARVTLPDEYDSDEELNISCTVSLFCHDVDEFINVIPRSLSALSTAKDKFVKEMTD